MLTFKSAIESSFLSMKGLGEAFKERAKHGTMPIPIYWKPERKAYLPLLTT